MMETSKTVNFNSVVNRDVLDVESGPVVKHEVKPFENSDAFFLNLVQVGVLSVFSNGMIRNNLTRRLLANSSTVISLRHNFEVHTISASRLVWLCYLGPVPEGKRIFKKNVQLPPSVNNIEADTFAERNPRIIREHRNKITGAKNSQALFTDQQVLDLRAEYKEKPFSLRAKAVELKTSHAIISMALTGKSYGYLPNAVEKILRPVAAKRERKPRVAKPPVVKPVKIKQEKPAKPKPVVTKPSINKIDRLELIRKLAQKRQSNV